jgi:hypothetical protein
MLSVDGEEFPLSKSYGFLSIPITLSDTHYGHTQEDTHYTEWESMVLPT